ncbi:MAG: hypothetical protein RBS39_12825 [Phycisphaerales bacterium]|jgi:hypothetical protein|nr:hypothetical protein [Phycisphaerales bacterium]
MTTLLQQITPGTRVKIVQQVRLGSKDTSQAVEGVVLRVGQQKTGSWFAHAKDKKLWLDRVELRKDDGELVVVNLDDATTVSTIGAA